MEIKENLDKVFFTSDTHFGHKNIIKYCNRPYNNVSEMNDALINNWNKVVPEDGIVFHLGDFCMGGYKVFKENISKLNGKIVLILGNHDEELFNKSCITIDDKLIHYCRQMTLNIDNKKVCLNHYPFLCYAGTYKDPNKCTWQLFGHLHLSLVSTGEDDIRTKICFPYQYDVGVDLNSYTPVSWETVKRIINFQIDNNYNVSHWINHGSK